MKSRFLKVVVILVLATVFFSCDSSRRETPAPGNGQATTKEESTATGQITTPIDCPLRKMGIDPHNMKPFEETEKYIAFLERPDRAEWQRPEIIVKALHLGGTETVADLGAGSGYFTFRLAAALPEGKVYAIDVEPEMLRHIHHKTMSEGVGNIEVVLATYDDPKVSEDTDLVFICDVLHPVQGRQPWLKRIGDALRPGSKLVLVEFMEGDLPAGPPASIKISRDEIVSLTENAGFRLAEDHSDLLPYQHFLVFVKK